LEFVLAVVVETMPFSFENGTKSCRFGLAFTRYRQKMSTATNENVVFIGEV
jgi:hypothetical protein